MNKLTGHLTTYSLIMTAIAFTIDPVPVVKVETKTGKCITVVSPIKDHTCNNLPENYIQESALE